VFFLFGVVSFPPESGQQVLNKSQPVGDAKDYGYQDENYEYFPSGVLTHKYSDSGLKQIYISIIKLLMQMDKIMLLNYKFVEKILYDIMIRSKM
jgi:hypothetical protein